MMNVRERILVFPLSRDGIMYQDTRKEYNLLYIFHLTCMKIVKWNEEKNSTNKWSTYIFIIRVRK
jgi:hypothetical protein